MKFFVYRANGSAVLFFLIHVGPVLAGRDANNIYHCLGGIHGKQRIVKSNEKRACQNYPNRKMYNDENFYNEKIYVCKLLSNGLFSRIKRALLMNYF